MFQRKQFHFLINSTRIPGQASIRSYYAVTWNDDGDLIMPHCTAYRLRGHMGRILHLCQLFCNLPIGSRLSIRNLQ